MPDCTDWGVVRTNTRQPVWMSTQRLGRHTSASVSCVPSRTRVSYHNEKPWGGSGDRFKESSSQVQIQQGGERC